VRAGSSSKLQLGRTSAAVALLATCETNPRGPALLCFGAATRVRLGACARAAISADPCAGSDAPCSSHAATSGQPFWTLDRSVWSRRRHDWHVPSRRPDRRGGGDRAGRREFPANSHARPVLLSLRSVFGDDVDFGRSCSYRAERPESPWSREPPGGASGWRCRDRKDSRWER
jgi:hypothetical protein